jgi:sterol desaturase/sphingolipid hydroxylase (fatty acid hydroxylase superfamily)
MVWDPFKITTIAENLHENIGLGSKLFWEHAVASSISLLLTGFLNACCIFVAFSLSTVLNQSNFLLPLHPNDLVSFSTILPPILNSNKTAFLTSAEQLQLSAVTTMARHNRLLQPIWQWASITKSNYTSSFAFPGILSLSSYFLGCLPFAFLDFIPYFRKYKIQPAKQPAKKGSWMNTIMCTIVLQLVFPVPAMIAQVMVFSGPWTYGYPGAGFCMLNCVWGVAKFPISAPTIVEFLTHLILCLIVFDVGYYIWHTLHHISRPLYKNIHSIHHEYYAPFVWVTQYTHFCELVLVASLSMTIPIAMGCHPLTHWVWLILIVQISIDSHTGYELPIGLDTFFPCCAGTRHHDTHHAWPKTNFQPFFTYMDWWNKTHYDQSEFKKRADKKNKEK